MLPRPALVTRQDALPLPRWALWLLCAAWVVPGVFGRDPWRHEDLAAFGVMSALAEGRTSWWAPALGGIQVDAEPLAHWLGAWAIQLLTPFIDPALAARLPFAALLAATLVCVWYATFHLARTEAARPVPLAFGGEPSPLDYARALADGAVLALVASLGLLQLGHETTPELVQLFAFSLVLWSLAAAPWRGWQAAAACVIGLCALAAAGAPAVALATALAGVLIGMRAETTPGRRHARWAMAGGLAAALTATALGTWQWRLGTEVSLQEAGRIARQWVWFLWPCWPLVLWALWSWRRQWHRRHLATPVLMGGIALATSLLMGGNDRALMLALPALAVLAALALPTLRRSATAALDWFSVLFFSTCVAFIWAMYIAMQTGVPARWAANIARLAPGFETHFSPLALLLATLGTLAWAGAVRWRTARRPSALWKSMVLPAGGVALCWLMLMTLWLPLLDYARSPRSLVERSLPLIGSPECVWTPGAVRSTVAALEVFARLKVEADASREPPCPVRVQVSREIRPPEFEGWELVGSVRRARESSDLLSVYRRRP